MIATILPSSANFHAVAYNEKKVAKGVARLLEMSNLGHIGVLSKTDCKGNAGLYDSLLFQKFKDKKHSSTLPFLARGMKKDRGRTIAVRPRISQGNGLREPKVSRCWYMLIPTLTTHIYI